MPTGWAFETTAPATEGAHCALANIRAARIDADSTVLVYGATGAIGSGAVQITEIDRQMVEDLKSLIVAESFTPVIDGSYTLDHIVDAYRYVETQQKIGNVVITLA